MNTGKYVGRPIYIHDKDGNDLASATILEYQPDYMIITVSAAVQTNSEFVTVLILDTDGVHEYQGKIRRGNAASTQIALFKGQVKEARSKKRYAIHTAAWVESLVLGTKSAPLLHPMEVFVVNISTSGVLLQAKPNCFRINSVVELKLPIVENSKPLHTKIIWIRDIDSESTEYGCEFI